MLRYYIIAAVMRGTGKLVDAKSPQNALIPPPKPLRTLTNVANVASAETRYSEVYFVRYRSWRGPVL
jgi:hypothetical protein